MNRISFSEDKFHPVFELSPVGIIFIDTQGIIKTCNPAAARLSGYPVEDIVGHHFTDLPLLRPTDVKALTKLFKSFLAGSVDETIEVQWVHIDGSLRYGEVRASLLRSNGKIEGLVAFVRDVTEKKSAERWQEALYRIAHAQARVHHLDQLYAAIHDVINDIIPADNFYIATYDKETRLLSFPYFVDQHDQPPPPLQQHKSLTGYVLRTGESLLCDLDKQAELVQMGEVEPMGEQSPIWLGVPLKIDDEVIGVMAVQHYNQRNAYGVQEQRMLEFVSSQVAHAIERKRTEQTIRENEERYRAIFESTFDGIFLLDLEANVIFCNQRAAEMLGYQAAQDLTGVSGFDHIIPSDQKEASNQLRQIFEFGSITETHFTVLRKDGSTFPAEFSAALLTDENGNPYQIIEFMRDITDRKQAENRIHQVNQGLERRVAQRTAQLESANQELEAFVYSVSHDLRAPLRAIQGFSRILLEDYAKTLDEEGQAHLSRILAGGEKMDRLIDDFLNLARLDRHALKPTQVDLAAIAHREFQEMVGTLPDRRVEYKQHPAPGDTSFSIYADPHLMEVMLTNLLSNALKFTRHKDPARIEFGHSMDNGQPTFFLRDNGIGFDPAFADKIFIPFQRLHQDQGYEGTGVGLAIVQRIVHRHGGKIWAESEVGKGASFYFSLPPNPGP